MPTRKLRTRTRRRRTSGRAITNAIGWRGVHAQLAQFHRDVLEDLTRRRADTQLLLLGGNMFTSPAVQPLLRPTLPNEPNVREAMLQLGLDVEQYADQERIVFCRPDRIAPRTPLNPQAVNINLATNPVVDSTFSRIEPAASLFYHEVLPISLPSFDAASPFGRENTHTALFTHVAPSGVYNRQRFVHHLALRDVQLPARRRLDAGPGSGRRAAAAVRHAPPAARTALRNRGAQGVRPAFPAAWSCARWFTTSRPTSMS